MAKVLLLAGTHDAANFWWRPGSPFVRGLEAAGHTLAAPEDPYSWSTALDGLVGGNDDWRGAGDALRWWLEAHPVDAIVAFSHGGAVVAYALAHHLAPPLPVLMTVGMPVRWDLRDVYALARPRVHRWWHVHSDAADWMQWLGSWFDGSRRNIRDLDLADENLVEPGISHRGLLDPDLWRRRGWFARLAPDLPV